MKGLRASATPVGYTANKSPADGLEWVSDPGIWIFLGSGICTAGIISQFDDVRITPAKVICIELNAQARKVADYANPKTDTFPGVEFEFHDVTMIPEGWLLAIAQDVSLRILIISMPCSDMSGLSKAKPRNEYDKIKQKMGLAQPPPQTPRRRKAPPPTRKQRTRTRRKSTRRRRRRAQLTPIPILTL